MKKFLFYLAIFIIVFTIYALNITEDVYYVSIGDYLSYGINNFGKIENNYSDNLRKQYNNLSNYINYSTIEDYRVVDLIRDIEDNKKIEYKGKTYTLQNLLIKANIITISIGMNDLIYKNDLTYKYVEQLLKDIDQMLLLIRKYNKEYVYILNFYNIVDNEKIIEYANEKLQNLCTKYKIMCVDISLLNNYIMNSYPTNDGYTYITEQILNFTK